MDATTAELHDVFGTVERAVDAMHHEECLHLGDAERAAYFVRTDSAAPFAMIFVELASEAEFSPLVPAGHRGLRLTVKGAVGASDSRKVVIIKGVKVPLFSQPFARAIIYLPNQKEK